MKHYYKFLILTLMAISAALSLNLMPSRVFAESASVATGENNFLGDEGDRAAIPYSQFWYSDPYQGKKFYLTVGTTNDWLNSSTRHATNPYAKDRTNWRMIQVGSYRMLKNSYTQKCISSDVSDDGHTTYTVTVPCNSSDIHQKYKAVLTGSKVQIKYYKNSVGYCIYILEGAAGLNPAGGGVGSCVFKPTFLDYTNLR